MKAFYCFALSLFCLVQLDVQAQTAVLTYPVQSPTNKPGKGFQSYLMEDNLSKQVILVLKTEGNVEYIQLDNSLRKKASFTSSNDSNAFLNADKLEFLGFSGGSNRYFGICLVTDKRFLNKTITYKAQTIDFESKTIAEKELFQIPSDEQVFLSFSESGQFYVITTNDKTNYLKFYHINEKGDFDQQSAFIDVKKYTSGSKFSLRLSEYLAGTKFVKNYEEANLSLGGSDKKFYSFPDRFEWFFSADNGKTKVMSISKKDYSVITKEIGKKAVNERRNPDIVFINTIFFDNKLFELAIQPNQFEINIYSYPEEKLLKKHSFNDNSSPENFAGEALKTGRFDKAVSEKKMDPMAKLIKELNDNGGTAAIAVTRNNQGQYIISAGYFAPTIISTYSSGGWQDGFVNSSQVGSPPRHVSNLTYKPGYSYTSTSPDRYTAVEFRLLVNNTTLELVKSKLPRSPMQQLKEYLLTPANKKRILQHFSFEGHQYTTAFDKESTNYTINNIPILE